MQRNTVWLFWIGAVLIVPQLLFSVQKCGFPYYVTGTGRTPAALPPSFHDDISKALQTEEIYISPSGHFRIHYVTDGYNAIPTYDRNGNGTPDYLEFVAKSFDRAWAIEIDSLGFKPPPDANGNPKSVYDVYCQNLAGQELYGYTYFDPTQDIPGLPGLNYTSDVYISTQFTFVVYEGVDAITRDSMAIAVTAAHEFNHALQLGYRIWGTVTSEGQINLPDLWFIESTATYMEEVVANEVNDYYQYLPEFFATTNLSITHTADPQMYLNRLYGEAIWFIQLGEEWGPEIVQYFWDNILEYPAAQAMREFFVQQGSSLTAAIQTMGEWRYYCGKNAIRGRYFPEAEAYPTPPVSPWWITDPTNGRDFWYSLPLETNSFVFLKSIVSTPQTVSVTVQPIPLPFIASLVFFREPPMISENGGVRTFELQPGQPLPMAVLRTSEEQFEVTLDTLHVWLRAGRLKPPVNQLKLFPTVLNLSEGQWVVNVSPVGEKGTITLFNAAGLPVATHSYSNANNVYSFSLRPYLADLTSGVYLIYVFVDHPSQVVYLNKLILIK